MQTRQRRPRRRRRRPRGRQRPGRRAHRRPARPYLGRDNANQITLQDGVPGITNQYLFQPIAGAFYAPCTDGGLDMGIVGHEYTHAITNRMVGGPDEGLTSEQGGAMGESWGDLVAGEYQFEHGYDNGGNLWAIGAYATGNPRPRIRDYAIDDNPLNYSDYGFDTTGPEVHADGEIWNGTMWEVRQALVDKYDASSPTTTRRCSCAARRRTRTASTPPAERLPGQPALDPADVRLVPAAAGRHLDARRPRRDARRRPDALRRRQPGRAVEGLRPPRHGRRRVRRRPPTTTSPSPSFAAPTAGNAHRHLRAPPAPAQVYVGRLRGPRHPGRRHGRRHARWAPRAAFTPGHLRAARRLPRPRLHPVHADRPGRRGARTVPVDDEANLARAAAGATVIGATAGSLNAERPHRRHRGHQLGRRHRRATSTTTNPSVAVDLAGDVQTVRRVQVSAYADPGPADPERAAARPGRPRLGLPLHRAAPVRPRGLRDAAAARRRRAGRGSTPRPPTRSPACAAAGRAGPDHAQLRRARHRGRRRPAGRPARTSAPGPRATPASRTTTRSTTPTARPRPTAARSCTPRSCRSSPARRRTARPAPAGPAPAGTGWHRRPARGGTTGTTPGVDRPPAHPGGWAPRCGSGSSARTSGGVRGARLKARLRLDGARADRLGHWVVTSTDAARRGSGSTG